MEEPCQRSSQLSLSHTLMIDSGWRSFQSTEGTQMQSRQEKTTASAWSEWNVVSFTQPDKYCMLMTNNSRLTYWFGFIVCYPEVPSQRDTHFHNHWWNVMLNIYSSNVRKFYVSQFHWVLLFYAAEYLKLHSMYLTAKVTVNIVNQDFKYNTYCSKIWYFCLLHFTGLKQNYNEHNNPALRYEISHCGYWVLSKSIPEASVVVADIVFRSFTQVKVATLKYINTSLRSSCPFSESCTSVLFFYI